MKVYKGFTASPGLVLGQVSRLDRPPLVFGEGPFHPEQEKQALEDAIKVAQQELDEMAAIAGDSVKVTVTVSADEAALPHDVKKYL